MANIEKITWVKQNDNCYFGYLIGPQGRDVMVFQLSRYSKWDIFRKGMWQLTDRLYRQGEYPCKSKRVAMKEAQERVKEVYLLVCDK